MEDALEKLIEQSSDSKSATWKWILGIVITLVVIFIQWKLKNQETKIAALEAERAMMKEKTVDLAIKLENEKNEACIGVHMDEIGRLQAEMAHRTVELYAKKKDVKEIKERVKKAKRWQDLEKLAGR